MKDFSNLYSDEYFINRDNNDPRRLASFAQEKALLQKHTSLSGSVCDVGCSTGEFLTAINWLGTKYGMEINQGAIEKAKAAGILFDKNILTESNYFDAVIFRGTIQHLPEPFHYISNTHRALKPGGIVAFLATPNANSLVYKIFNTLPALGPKHNFYIPSDITLTNILSNFGFEIAEIKYPYLDSPYANPLRDHYRFLLSILFRLEPKFPFWKSMMNVIARKV